MKLYKINVYQSYIEDACGISWFIYKPGEIDYKCEILEEVEIELPEGVTREDLIFLSSEQYCIIINNKDYTVCLASSDRITNWFNPSALPHYGQAEFL